MTPPAQRIKVIKRELDRLHLGDDDTRVQLLRESNQLHSGDSTKTDQQLLDEWYDPPIKAIKAAAR